MKRFVLVGMIGLVLLVANGVLRAQQPHPWVMQQLGTPEDVTAFLNTLTPTQAAEAKIGTYGLSWGGGRLNGFHAVWYRR